MFTARISIHVVEYETLLKSTASASGGIAGSLSKAAVGNSPLLREKMASL